MGIKVGTMVSQLHEGLIISAGIPQVQKTGIIVGGSIFIAVFFGFVLG